MGEWSAVNRDFAKAAIVALLMAGCIGDPPSSGEATVTEQPSASDTYGVDAVRPVGVDSHAWWNQAVAEARAWNASARLVAVGTYEVGAGALIDGRGPYANHLSQQDPLLDGRAHAWAYLFSTGEAGHYAVVMGDEGQVLFSGEDNTTLIFPIVPGGPLGDQPPRSSEHAAQRMSTHAAYPQGAAGTKVAWTLAIQDGRPAWTAYIINDDTGQAGVFIVDAADDNRVVYRDASFSMHDGTRVLHESGSLTATLNATAARARLTFTLEHPGHEYLSITGPAWDAGLRVRVLHEGTALAARDDLNDREDAWVYASPGPGEWTIQVRASESGTGTYQFSWCADGWEEVDGEWVQTLCGAAREV